MDVWIRTVGMRQQIQCSNYTEITTKITSEPEQMLPGLYQITQSIQTSTSPMLVRSSMRELTNTSTNQYRIPTHW